MLQKDFKFNFVKFQLEIFGQLEAFKLVILQKDCSVFKIMQIKFIEVVIKLNLQILKLNKK